MNMFITQSIPLTNYYLFIYQTKHYYINILNVLKIYFTLFTFVNESLGLCILLKDDCAVRV